MSDLQDKFTTLEAQLATQHTELIAGMNDILAALGAPPTSPTTTLEDVVTAINATNTLLATTNGYLLDVFNTLDTINNNAALNAQRLLTAIIQSACPCDTSIPPLAGPLDVTPTTATNTAKCQRIQYFIDLFFSWYVHVAEYLESGSISSFQIDNLLQIQLGDLSITTGQLAAGIPSSTRDSIGRAISAATFAAGGTSPADVVSAAMFDVFNDAAVKEAMRQALYGATDAADGSAAAIAAINAAIGSAEIAGITESMFYSAWPNDIYSDVPIVDASAYDGDICAPAEEGCITINSTVVTFGGDGPASSIVWPAPLTAEDHTPSGYTASAAVWCTTNLAGYTIRPSIDIKWFEEWNATALIITAGTLYTCFDTDHCAIHIFPSTTPFTIELCAPAS